MSEAAINTRSNVRIVVAFFLMLGVFNGLYQVEKRYSGRIVDGPYTTLVTSAAGVLGDWILPFQVKRVSQIALGGERASIVVGRGCNGLEAIFLMVAAVLAYPASWNRRLRALALYLPILFGLNLLRIMMLLFVMVRHPSYMDAFHFLVAQGILIVFIFGFWMHYVQQAES